MFQREVKFIYDFTINKIKKIGSPITYDALISADIHPAILQYISGEISYMISADREKLLKDSAFDYSSKNIQNLFRLIEDELKKSKRFDLEFLSRLVMYAVSFNVNHLVKPRWTLIRFIFDKEETKTVAEIKQTLYYTYYYDYLNSIILNYLAKKKLTIINKSDFEEVLLKLDSLGFESFLNGAIDTHLEGVSDFFNIGGINKTKIPLAAFELFLSEKNLSEYVLLLKDTYGDDLKIKIEQNEIKKLLRANPIVITNVANSVNNEPKQIKTIIPENLQLNNNIVEKNEVESIKPQIVEPEIKEEIKIEEEKLEETVLEVNENLNNEVVEEKEIETTLQVEKIEIDSEAAEIINKSNETPKTDEIKELSLESEEIIFENKEEIELEHSDELVDQDETLDEIKIEEEHELTVVSDFTSDVVEGVESKHDQIETIEETTEFKDEYEFEEILEQKVIDKINEDEIVEEIEDQHTDIKLDVDTELKEETTKEQIIAVEENKIEDEVVEETISLSFDDFVEEKEEKETEESEEENIEEIIEEPKKEGNRQVEIIEESKIDIDELFNQKGINKIIDVVFGGDVEEFAETVEKIGQFQDADEALTFIETYCYNLGFDDDKKEVVHFKRVIEEHFRV